jgi:hypothetical protein
MFLTCWSPRSLEGVIELVADVIAHHSADTDTPRLGQPLQPRRDIHTVTEDVVFLNDHIAEIDAHTEPDPALPLHLGLALGHPALEIDRTPDGIHHARELGQEAVAGALYDPTPVLLDLGLNQLPKVGLKSLVRPLLIRAH